MVESTTMTNSVVRSRLKELVTKKEIELGRRIKQNEIAEQTGLNPNTISRWMTSQPMARIETEPAIKLCEWLDCELGDLMYIDRRQ